MFTHDLCLRVDRRRCPHSLERARPWEGSLLQGGDPFDGFHGFQTQFYKVSYGNLVLTNHVACKDPWSRAWARLSLSPGQSLPCAPRAWAGAWGASVTHTQPRQRELC